MEIFGVLLFLFSLIFHTSLLVSLYHVLRAWTRSTQDKELWSAANWFVSALQATFATGVGLVGISRSGTDMLHIRLPFLRPFAWFSLGYWLYDLVCLFILVTGEQELEERRRRRKNHAAVQPPRRSLPRSIVSFVCWWPGIVFHHLGIMAFLVIGILTTSRVQGDSIIGYSLLMELSSVFVALRSAIMKLSWKESRLYLVVSIIMLVTFFLCRILLMPVVIHLYCRQLGLGYLTAVLALPLKCKIGTSSFYALNLYWFSLMVKGAVKVYRKKAIMNINIRN